MKSFSHDESKLPCTMDDCKTNINESEEEGQCSASDRLGTMLYQEETNYQCPPSYLSQEATHSSPSIDNDNGVNENWRQQISEWGYDVVDHFNFNREVVSISMSYLDRYVSSLISRGEHLTRRDFQLVAVSSLYLAMKLHGESHEPKKIARKIHIFEFVKLSRNIFLAETIEKMELDILSTLDWRMNPPTMARFHAELFELFPGHPPSSLIERARYLAEISVCVSSIVIKHKPSIIAFSALLNAMDEMDTTSLPHVTYDAFLDTIERTTSLTNKMTEVKTVRATLNNMCLIPNEDEQSSLQESDESNSSFCDHSYRTDHFESGKTSPVCVMETPAPPPSKRQRSIANTRL